MARTKPNPGYYSGLQQQCLDTYKRTLTGLGRIAPDVVDTVVRLKAGPVAFTDLGPVLRLSVAVFLMKKARERRPANDAMFPACAF